MSHETDPREKLKSFIDLAGRAPGSTEGIVGAIHGLSAEELEELAAADLGPDDYVFFAEASTQAHRDLGIDLTINAAEAKGFMGSITDLAKQILKR